MKIAIICATGKAGKLIMEESIARGHDVTAIVRDLSKLSNQKVKVLEKDLFDINAEDLKNFEVVINAFGVWELDKLSQITQSQSHLCDCVKNTDTRLLIVGGAGGLYVDSKHTIRVMDLEGFPEIYKPLANAHNQALDSLRLRKDVKWTSLSPAGDFQADGIRTGEYKLGGDELILNSKGESIVSYADYAIAMVDEAEKGHYIQKRISVVSK